MTNPGEPQMGLPVDLSTIARGGNGHKPAHRALAIVGSHPATRENAPYDDPCFEIWLHNEAAQKPEVYRRWDAVIQIHSPEVYSNPRNWVNSKHWDWLQEKRGKPIYMQEVDPRVPDSVRYPLEGVLAMTPYRYLRSSVAMALALAIYLGYDEIWLYGSELSSNTEYSYQATNYAFWIGFASGRGIDLHLECWHDEFYQRIYGYDGELQIDREYYLDRLAEYEPAWRSNERMLTKLQGQLDEAMINGEFDKVGSLSVELENAALAAGETFGVMSEARRYGERTDMISRQEFERGAAQAQETGDDLRTERDRAFGRCEYVWNAWKQSGKLAALNQLRTLLKEKTQFAYDTGVKYGMFTENMRYMAEYDKRLQMAGGVRALGNPAEYQMPVKT